MGIRQYIGARYTPKFMGEYDNTITYENLCVVDNGAGTSYISTKVVPAGTPLTNTEYWAVYGASSGAVVDLQNRVSTLENEIDDKASEEDLESLGEIIKSGKNCLANVLLNYVYIFDNFAYNAQGGCYVGNGRYVQYYSSQKSNTGVLVCYDIDTCTELWRYALQLYHGNSITYNKYNNKIYVSGCVQYNLSTYINAIFVISMDSPNVIERTITLPSAKLNYSLTFDNERREFYATNQIGTTSGEANILTVYNEGLDEVLRTIALPDYPAVKYGISVQGVQMGLNGIAYILTYGRSNYIIGYNATTGNVESIYNLPEHANECRKLNESENLSFDYDKKRTLCGFVTYATEAAMDGQIFSLCEIDAFKEIEYISPKAYREDDFNANENSLQVSHGSANLKPLWHIVEYQLPSGGDAFNYCRIHGETMIHFIESPVYRLYRPILHGVRCRIFGGGANSKLDIYKADISNANIGFWYCNFTGSLEWASSLYTNMRAILSTLFFHACNFADIPENVSKNHMVLYFGCNVMADTTNTYEGDFSKNIRTASSILNGVYS